MSFRRLTLVNAEQAEYGAKIKRFIRFIRNFAQKIKVKR